MSAKLTTEQIQEVRGEMVRDGIPVRFQINGQTMDIVSGNLQAGGINVMFQAMYWHFTRETSRKIGDWLGAKAVFDKA